jgi:hypothetical protein
MAPLPSKYKIEPMDLANMRANGVRSLDVDWPASGEMVCGRTGAPISGPRGQDWDEVSAGTGLG